MLGWVERGKNKGKPALVAVINPGNPGVPQRWCFLSWIVWFMAD